jgi:hypothetical protein
MSVFHSGGGDIPHRVRRAAFMRKSNKENQVPVTGLSVT